MQMQAADPLYMKNVTPVTPAGDTMSKADSHESQSGEAAKQQSEEAKEMEAATELASIAYQGTKDTQKK